MSKISTAAVQEKVFPIPKWLGLHQNPDGDTKLKFGEAARMVNYRVTRDGNLQRRGGYRALASFGNIQGLWRGTVMGTNYVVVAADGKLYWAYEFAVTDTPAFNEIGDCGNGDVYMFAFGERMYVLCDTGYMEWDGEIYSEVVGYVPIVSVATKPTGGGTLLEQANKLTAKRRCRFSPDGTAVTFQLPETDLKSIDKVVYLPTGAELTISSRNVSAGTVTLSAAPAQNTDTVEVWYTAKRDFRGDVESMKFHEIYNGSADTRVFLYGDGSNKAIYSDLDFDGTPRADYFPDLNVVDFGDSNTPVTAMIRHMSKLIVFKGDSCYSVSYSSTALADGSTAAAFYGTCVNKAIGCDAPGQAVLVLNSPFTVNNSDIYEWVGSQISGNLTYDERQAKRISDRVTATLNQWNTRECVCCDDNYGQEYYCCYGDKALVYNYAANTWSYYDNFPVKKMIAYDGVVLFGGTDGKLYEYSTKYRTDDGEPIEAIWESGSVSFGADYMKKSVAVLWLGIKPESATEVTVTVETDRKSKFTEKVVANNFSTFSNVDFNNFGFSESYKPKIKRLKIKAKKFVYYKLIFKTTAPGATATIVASDIRVRFVGYAK